MQKDTKEWLAVRNIAGNLTILLRGLEIIGVTTNTRNNLTIIAEDQIKGDVLIIKNIYGDPNHIGNHELVNNAAKGVGMVPTIIMGDFNEDVTELEKDLEQIRESIWEATHATDGYTFRSERGTTANIDAIFSNHSIIQEKYVKPIQGTDHLMVWARIEVEQEDRLYRTKMTERRLKGTHPLKMLFEKLIPKNAKVLSDAETSEGVNKEVQKVFE